MTTTGDNGAPVRPNRSDIHTEGWLWAHIGRLSGIAFGVLALIVIIFLAAIGFTPAFGLLLFLLVGTALIFVGGRIKNS